ncbi:2-dehydro-3-deoxygalactonokinase [Bacillus horti]|uniref:2-dehydro-3-deoxygalactonokinase n=1 Tax=Caldalkalibacillus horti TaxID=77523 RepID=A0ABT9VVP3_9BACI|nr:2-dehydro-3-deoxygalactonokinase [Bacillus horti]MDQ0165048.1 2-dehydro-3-deoxygalactonokinase [Bacillus horti]
MYIIAIDSGTTNTRVRLVKAENTTIVDQIKRQVGVRNTAIEGHNGKLKDAIITSVAELLERNNLSSKDIAYMVASGMLTSPLGILELPHALAPADIDALVSASVQKEFTELQGIPCLFVPGVKSLAAGSKESEAPSEVAVEQINQFDVMRGEEVEAFGLVQQHAPRGKGLIILPGSHTKYVSFSEQGRIESSVSTLSGEMLQALSQETILAASLGQPLLENVEPDTLLAGFRQGIRLGLTRVLFHVRLLDLFADLSKNQRANYFVGCLLAADLQILKDMLLRENPEWIMVGGSNPLREVFITLLREGWQDLMGETANQLVVIEATDEQVDLCTAVGAIQVAEEYWSRKKP